MKIIKNKNLFLLLSSVFFVTTIYAGTNSYGEEVPESDGNTRMFDVIDDTNTSQLSLDSDLNTTDNNDMIGEDTLPREDIPAGAETINNFGPEASGESVIDSHGNRVYVKRLTATENVMLRNDPSNPANADLYTEENIVDGNNSAFSTMSATSDYVKSDRYKTYREQYEDFYKENNMTVKAAQESRMTATITTENTFTGNSLNEYRGRFLQGVNIAGEAEKTTRNFRSQRDFGNDELNERDENATNLYTTTYRSGVSIADRENVLNTNYGALTKALSSSDEIAAELKSRISAATIQCQISRNLIPSYKCPIPGLDGLMYPGNPDLGEIRKVNTAEAKKECNDICWTPTDGSAGTLSCVRQTVLDNNDTDIDLNSSVTLYPNWDRNATTFTFETTPIMPVDKIRFNFAIPRPQSISEEDWADFLREAKFKVNYSVLIKDESEYGDVDMLPFTIVDRETIDLYSENVEFTTLIGRTTSEVIIKIWEPFITPNRLEQYRYEHYFEELENNNTSIQLVGMDADYKSDSYYFCQALQMVDSPQYCVGGDTVLFEAVAGQIYYLCSSDDRKIGPEPLWGAFYDQDSCQAACTVHRDCKPTYRHYTSYGTTEDYLYDARVNCVDDPTNTSCSDSACEALFASTERPNNEIVVQNDDTYVYTIRSKSLTGVARPKIDLSAELAGTVDYQQVFDNEEKDSAYLDMLDNVSFNRVKYHVGDPSPWNLAYKLDSYDNGAHSVMNILLKPESTQYDDGNTYYVYAIMRVLSSYSPIAGSWYLDSHLVTADPDNTNIQWEDYTYLIKNSETNGDWSVFKKDEFAKFLVVRNDMEITDTGDLVERNVIDWVNMDAYVQNSFATYDESSDLFVSFDKNQLAPSFKQVQFSSTQNYFDFQISDYIQRDITETPGLRIKRQEAINHETDFRKIYQDPLGTNREVSNAKDYVVYLIYSDTRLSYDQLLTRIEGPNYDMPSQKELPINVKEAAYQLVNEQLFKRDDVEYDGELNNNIHVLKKGSPSNTTVSVDWGPSMSEKGKKAFKFIFLYDDQIENPFEITNDN